MEEAKLSVTDIVNMHQGEYIIVAYHDRRYPGCIENIKEERLTVRFMTPCRQAGLFVWLTRDDIQDDLPEFVIEKGVVA